MTDVAVQQKKRFTTMIAIDVVCFLLAGAAIVGHVAFGVGWLLPVFVLAIVAGLSAQIWFVVGWLKATRPQDPQAGRAP
ncbi:hypothetical protein DDF62_13275 [Caulobacter radicis]|jgi:hypothetical protein|uniref:hypothetical protein n=1 Tax=Caulobacter radicis TaxID=2172650 RepID=UPI000D579D90|nr:hypothetical protein [Caulobacter radicis]PVM88889.1 hypothetical protein DDF62_13275 [Caulobacter radicis]